MMAVCCGVEAIQGGPAEWTCRRQRNGATLWRRTVASGRSAGLRGSPWCCTRPWAQEREQSDVAEGCCAGAVRVLCGACGRAVGGS